MPNLCNYEMMIQGSKDAIQNVIDCLKADYNYHEGKPAHRHFFRVFDCFDEQEMEDWDGEGTYTMYVFGDCAWAVHCCMCDDEGTYYDDVKKEHPDIFMGISLREASELYDCDIEVYSEEWGCGFTEHYLYRKGVCVIDESKELVEVKNPLYDKNKDDEDKKFITCNPYYEDSIEEQVEKYVNHECVIGFAWEI